MRPIETIVLAIGMLILSNAQENNAAPLQEAEEPLVQPRGGVRPPVTPRGEIHRNIADKRCLAYQAYSRPHIVNTHIFDYVVTVTNKCPTSIRLRICQKDGSGCNGVFAQAYPSRDVMMGFGPFTDIFDYIAKEAQ